jgi:hypothetical protein
VSAELLALAVRAADAYARVRGPWSRRCRTFFVERDELSRHRLVVRDADPGWHKNMVVFDPLPRKEVAVATPPPARPESFVIRFELDALFDSNAELTSYDFVGAHVTCMGCGEAVQLLGLATHAQRHEP